MLNGMFTVMQLLFTLIFIQSFMNQAHVGECSFKTVVIMSFILLSMVIIGILINANLLKSRILSMKAAGAVQKEEDRKHLLFLIEDRKIKSRGALITEFILLIMVNVYGFVSGDGLIKLVGGCLLAHGLLVFALVVMQLLKDKQSKQTIQGAVL